MSTEPLSSSQSGPLAALTVIDLTHALAGPFASFLLAGLGACVIVTIQMGNLAADYADYADGASKPV